MKGSCKAAESWQLQYSPPDSVTLSSKTLGDASCVVSMELSQVPAAAMGHFARSRVRVRAQTHASCSLALPHPLRVTRFPQANE